MRQILIIALLAGTSFGPTGTWKMFPDQSVALAQAPVTNPAWTFTGSLNTKHSPHTATLLTNGKVLVVGGVGAELYDPERSQWSSTGNLITPRGGHIAVRLANGKVLVAGGNSVDATRSVLSSAEIYDPDTGVWSLAGNLTVPRANHTANLMADGTVLVIGGQVILEVLPNRVRYLTYSSTEIYDPATNTWSSGGTMPSPHAHHASTVLANGNVLVIGGDNDHFNQRSTALFDPATRTWRATGDLISARWEPRESLLPDGRVLVAGGDGALDGAELYDPVTGQWSETGFMTTWRRNHTLTSMPGGKVLAAGGHMGDEDYYTGNVTVLDTAELYDPVTGRWSPTGSMNVARSDHTATLLANGKVLVAGGFDNGGAHNSAELYDAGSNQIDNAQFFIRQQYRDFLNREPDQGGLDYWTSRITECASDARCIHERRIGVSAAFFVEREFQETGNYVYRFYKASFGRQPSFTEFMADRSQVNGGANLETSKQMFAEQWVQRPTFVAVYPITISNTQFVNQVFDNAGLTASLYDQQRQQVILTMNAGRSRALVLRDVIEIPDFKNPPDPNDPRYNELKQISQYNPSFVLMQYFGYLRRDRDQGGYDFWLDVVNNREPNNYRAMVCAFITSREYQVRFGSTATRTNADCAQ